MKATTKFVSTKPLNANKFAIKQANSIATINKSQIKFNSFSSNLKKTIAVTPVRQQQFQSIPIKSVKNNIIFNQSSLLANSFIKKNKNSTTTSTETKTHEKHLD